MTEIRVHDILQERIVSTYNSMTRPSMGEHIYIDGVGYRVAMIDHHVSFTGDKHELALIEVGVVEVV